MTANQHDVELPITGPFGRGSLRWTTIATTDLIATEMLSLEAAIRTAIPHAEHIDLELAHADQESDDEVLA